MLGRINLHHTTVSHNIYASFGHTHFKPQCNMHVQVSLLFVHQLALLNTSDCDGPVPYFQLMAYLPTTNKKELVDTVTQLENAAVLRKVQTKWPGKCKAYIVFNNAKMIHFPKTVTNSTV